MKVNFLALLFVSRIFFYIFSQCYCVPTYTLLKLPVINSKVRETFKFCRVGLWAELAEHC